MTRLRIRYILRIVDVKLTWQHFHMLLSFITFYTFTSMPHNLKRCYLEDIFLKTMSSFLNVD